MWQSRRVERDLRTLVISKKRHCKRLTELIACKENYAPTHHNHICAIYATTRDARIYRSSKCRRLSLQCSGLREQKCKSIWRHFYFRNCKRRKRYALYVSKARPVLACLKVEGGWGKVFDILKEAEAKSPVDLNKAEAKRGVVKKMSTIATEISKSFSSAKRSIRMGKPQADSFVHWRSIRMGKARFFLYSGELCCLHR
jgi:hypothetical protein